MAERSRQEIALMVEGLKEKAPHLCWAVMENENVCIREARHGGAHGEQDPDAGLAETMMRLHLEREHGCDQVESEKAVEDMLVAGGFVHYVAGSLPSGRTSQGGTSDG